MKTRILTFTLFVWSISTGFAQWNSTGDNTSTGNLTIGNSQNNSYSKFVIRGPNQPLNSGSKRDISFEFNQAGKAQIRSYRGPSWDTYLQFLTTPTGGGDPISRFQINANGNIGIGTSPSDLLHLRKDDASIRLSSSSYFGGNGGALNTI